MPIRVVDLLASWKGQFDQHHNAHIWNAIPLCLMWCVWRKTPLEVWCEVGFRIEAFVLEILLQLDKCHHVLFFFKFI
jgi:hypothetical protein